MARQKSQAALIKQIASKAGKYHESVKDTEAVAGGRQISPNLKDALGQVASYKIDQNKNGQPYVRIGCVCIENPDGSTEGGDVGTPFSLMHTFAERGNLTMEACVQMFYRDLKLLGMPVKKKDSLEDVLLDAEDYFQEKPCFLFNTGKPSEQYEPRVYVQGVTDANGKPTPSKGPVFTVEEEEEPDTVEYDEGDIVSVDFDGEMYEGVIQAVDPDNEQAEVYFEADDSTETVAFSDIMPR